jgi:PIN domain nuclease of toxin-antitoxin system
MAGSERLSRQARELILDIDNELMVSAVSIYEIELKAKRGRVDLPPQELRAALRRNAVRDLAVTHEHAEYAACLDWDHRDPWDRLLASQARLESCALVSTDEVFDGIGVDRHW